MAISFAANLIDSELDREKLNVRKEVEGNDKGSSPLNGLVWDISSRIPTPDD